MLPEYMNVYADESNEDPTYKRNRIRREILPLLKSENINFYKFYWNFHEWEPERMFDELTLGDGLEKKIPEYFQIPSATTIGMNRAEIKRILDFYLSMLKFPPLYKSMFDNFVNQFSDDRAQIESKDYLIYREKKGIIHLIRKDASLFRPPKIQIKNDQIEIQWNHNLRTMENQTGEISIGTQKPGESIQMSFGKKEISEVLRDHRIPYFLRDQIPIVYKKNLPIQILLSMFDPSLQDYPKSISDKV